MKSPMTATTVASAVLAAMLGGASAHATAEAGPRANGEVARAVQWLAANPTEFQALLAAIHDGDVSRCDSIVQLAALSDDGIGAPDRRTDARAEGEQVAESASRYRRPWVRPGSRYTRPFRPGSSITTTKPNLQLPKGMACW